MYIDRSIFKSFNISQLLGYTLLFIVLAVMIVFRYFVHMSMPIPNIFNQFLVIFHVTCTTVN